jgi:insertion element IS1 protein InsB
VNPYFAAQQQANSSSIDIEIVSDAEGDEFWSFVGSKKQQRWTWYVLERSSGTILAYHNGRRTDESCKQLFEKLAPFSLGNIYTDNWQLNVRAFLKDF